MTAAQDAVECCPKFNPEPWQDREITWEGKRFVKDHVFSFLHIPLNFGSVMVRNMGRIEAAGAQIPDMIVLTDENSLFGCDVYLEVGKDVPGAEMVTLSGTFLSKVFEGPYSKVHGWTKDVVAFATARGKPVQRLWYYYTTCPKCARKYGKNYIAILAQV